MQGSGKTISQRGEETAQCMKNSVTGLVPALTWDVCLVNAIESHYVLSIRLVATLSVLASCNCIFLCLETGEKLSFSEVRNYVFSVFSALLWIMQETWADISST